MYSRNILFAFTLTLTVQGFFFSGCSCNHSKTPVTDSTGIDTIISPLIKGLTEKIKENPANPENYYQRSLAFLQLHSIKNAYSDMQRAIMLDSSNAKYYLAITDIYLTGGYADGAIESLNTLIRREPDNQEAITKLSKVYYYEKDYNNSLKQILTLLKKDENNAEAYFILGMNYKEMKDTAKAIAAFQKAVQRKENFYDAYMQLGLLHAQIKSKTAPQYFDNAIRLDSTSAEAYYAKAKYYQDAAMETKKKGNASSVTQDIETSKKIYRKLILKDPQYENAYFNLGFIYLQQDSIDKAYKYFDFAIKVSPRYAEAYYYRGLCSEIKGNTVQAKSDIENALALKPGYILAEEELKNLSKKK